jgi:hypothetical protein
MHPIRTLFLLGTLSLLAACDMSSEKAGAPAVPAINAPHAPAADAGTTDSAPAVVTEYTGTAPAKHHSNCSIDAINGRPATDFNTDASTGATFEGWAVNNAIMPANAIRIVLIGDKSYSVEGTTGVDRADVAAAVGKGAETSGFRIVVPVLEIPRGNYSARIEGADGSFSCETRARVVVN